MPLPKTVAIRQYLVSRTRYIGSQRFAYVVWEQPPAPPADAPEADKWPKHSTLTHHDGHEHWWGQLGTRHLPPEINALPVGEDRFAACRQHREAQIRLARRIIFQAYPHLLPLYNAGATRLDSTLAQIEATEVGDE